MIKLIYREDFAVRTDGQADPEILYDHFYNKCPDNIDLYRSIVKDMNDLNSKRTGLLNRIKQDFTKEIEEYFPELYL